MNRSRRMWLALSVALVVILSLTSVVLANTRTYSASLKGAEEVPPVDTNAVGRAMFTLNSDRTELSYTVTVVNIENAMMAHIHLAPAGVNGGVVAWLYPDAPPPQVIEGKFSGTLATGTITADDLVGDLAGQPLTALVNAIRSGNAYVNVHTTANPGGEIRGQIR